MNYDGLMVVAHQDDDALFGGVFQKSTPWMHWGVVCCTTDGNDERDEEMKRWQASLGVRSEDVHFLGMYVTNEDWMALERGIDQCTLDQTELAYRLKSLGVKGKVCLTHNPLGERSVLPKGHPHHKCVNRAVKAVDIYECLFVFGWEMESVHLAMRVKEYVEDARLIYRSQERPIQNIHNLLKCCKIGVYTHVYGR